MKTFETNLYDYKLSIKLMKYLMKKKALSWPFHFFFEPQLIIRTNNKIGPILKEYHIKYKIYPYPYPKKGFGEAKKWKKYQWGLVELYSIYAVLSLYTKGKAKEYILNRTHHTMTNMLGMEYYDESKYYIKQANSYMNHQYKVDGRLSTLLLQRLMSFLYKLL